MGTGKNQGRITDGKNNVAQNEEGANKARKSRRESSAGQGAPGPQCRPVSRGKIACGKLP